jgi:hypothetical protein
LNDVVLDQGAFQFLLSILLFIDHPLTISLTFLRKKAEPVGQAYPIVYADHYPSEK